MDWAPFLQQTKPLGILTFKPPGGASVLQIFYTDKRISKDLNPITGPHPKNKKKNFEQIFTLCMKPKEEKPFVIPNARFLGKGEASEDIHSGWGAPPNPFFRNAIGVFFGPRPTQKIWARRIYPPAFLGFFGGLMVGRKGGPYRLWALTKFPGFK